MSLICYKIAYFPDAVSRGPSKLNRAFLAKNFEKAVKLRYDKFYSDRKLNKNSI